MWANRLGFTFPFTIRLIGFGLLFWFFWIIWSMLSNIISSSGLEFTKILTEVAQSLIPLSLGIFFAFTSYGVQIDPDHDRFREYGQFLFIKTGKWKKLSDRPYLSILKKNKTYKGRARGVADVGTYNFKVYELSLLSEDHRQGTTVSFPKIRNGQK